MKKQNPSRPLLRRLTALVAIGMLFPSAMAVQVTRGPYLQIGTPTSVHIRWRTDVAANSTVRYGLTPGALNSAASDSTSTTEHEVVVNGLSPDTEYFYSVGTSTATLAGDSSYVFFTAPPVGTAFPTRIWVIGDAGTGTASQTAVRNAYYYYAGSRYTDVWLMLGDNAYQSGTDSEYQTRVFDVYDTLFRRSVCWPTIGNHDTAQSQNPPLTIPYFQNFSLPMNGEAGGLASGTEKYYAFDFGEIHFVCLDSMTSSRQPGSPMLTWLNADLASTTAKWLIAYWHHPPYSKGHDSDTDAIQIQMRQNVLPILEQNGVDLVLCGHTHAYERTFLLDGHYGLSSTLTSAMIKDAGSGREDDTGAYVKPTVGLSPHEGAVYVVAGSSGQTGNYPLNHPAMYVSLARLGSLVVDVNGNRLDVSFLRETGAIDDYFTLIKGAPSNAPPTVAVTSPSDGASFTAPVDIPITANAQDPDGSIAQVVFYVDSIRLGSVTTPPYSWVWSNASPGQHVLTANAVDDLGATASSSDIHVTVNGGGSQSPFVTGVNLGTVRNDYNGWLGMNFTVGSAPVSVTALGRYNVSNGSGVHVLKLVDAASGNDVPNGSVNVSLSGGAQNQFVYAPLPSPVNLPANTSYYLVSQESDGGDAWGHWDSNVATATVGTCDGAVYSGNGSFYAEHPGANSALGPVSFLYAGTAANMAPTVSVTRPSNGAGYTAPANIAITAAASDTDGTVVQVAFYANAVFLGSDSTAPFTFNWSNVPAGNYTLTARATDDAGAVSTSSGVNITVSSGASSTPFISGVTLGRIRNDYLGWLGMKFTIGPAPVTVTALGRIYLSGSSGTHLLKLVDASDGSDVPNGSVSVSLASGIPGQFNYANLGQPVVLNANASYYLVSQENSGGDSWGFWDSAVTTAAVGTCDGAVYSLDGSNYAEHPGADAPLGPVSFIFGGTGGGGGGGNQPPAVSITSPADHATLAAPANITIQANATDTDGTVSQVQFFANGSLVGTDTTAPFSYAWNNVAAGNYTLTAVATDDGGASTTSSGVSVSVNASSSPGNFVTAVNLGQVRNDYSGWLGMRFTVGSAPLTLTALGRFNVSGGTGTHTVKLVRASDGTDVPNGLATVVLGSGTTGQFVYGNLPSAIDLAANTSYYLVSQENSGGDSWGYWDSSVTTSSVGACDGAVYSLNGSSYSFVSGVNAPLGPVDFQYLSGNGVAATSQAVMASTVPPIGSNGGAKAAGSVGPIPVRGSPVSQGFLRSFNPGRPRNDFNGWLGMKFTIGSKPVTVTALGRSIVPRASGVHVLKLVDAMTQADIPNGAANVDLGAGTSGQFAYGNLLVPVMLAPNKSYYLVSRETLGGDPWFHWTGRVTIGTAGVCDGPVYSRDGSRYTARPFPNTALGVVDFQYVTGQSAPQVKPLVLAWDDTSDNEDAFEIERSTDGIHWMLVGSVGSDVTTYADATVQPATTYFYRVRATNSSGASGYSNVATAKTP